MEIGSVAQKNLSWGHLSQLCQLEERTADAFLKHLWLGQVHQNLLQRVQQWSSERWQWVRVSERASIHFYRGCNATHTQPHITQLQKDITRNWQCLVFLVKHETEESSVVLPVRPMPNTTHDGIYQRLIIIDDAAEAMEERHGCTDPFSHWAVRGRVDVCLEGESYQICTPLARLQLTAVLEWVTSFAARCTRAALSCYHANDVCQMLSVCDSFHVTKLNWCECYY